MKEQRSLDPRRSASHDGTGTPLPGRPGRGTPHLDPNCRAAPDLPNAQEHSGSDWSELRLAPDVVHPDCEHIEVDTTEWAAETGLTDQRDPVSFQRARFPRLAARIFPNAPAEHVQSYARWMVILFALDDRFDENCTRPDDVHNLYMQIEHALTGGVVTSRDPLVKAVREQWDITAAPMSSAWRHRFIRHLRCHGQALAWEAVLRRQAHPPTLAAFMALRPWANGMFMWDLVETVHQCEVPTALTHTLSWHYLTTCSNDITAWRNDLASVSRDAACGNHDNYVIVLAYALGRTFEETSPLIEKQITARTDELLQYEQSFLKQSRQLHDGSSDIRNEVARTLRTMTAAHAHWVIESGRYPPSPLSSTVTDFGASG